jgi:radical SAM protein with 4Fe4S-binding SPASM domain
MVNRVRAILFEVETACCLECNYCYNAWKAVDGYPKGRLSTRKTIRALRKLMRESGATQLACTGGEPLLRDDLPDIVAAMTLAGTTVSVLTNGRLLTPDWAQDLKRTGVKLVQLTLLSMNPEVHDAHCGAGAFGDIMKAAQILKQTGIPLAITVVVTNKTLDELPELMTYMKSIGQTTFLLNRYNPGGNLVKKGEQQDYMELMMSKEDTQRMLQHAEDGARKLGMRPVVAVPIPMCVVDRSAYPAVQFAGCAASTDNAYFTMDPLGNIRMCNHSPVILGNILKDSFLDIANGPEAEKWLTVKPDECKPCPAWDQCKAGCRAVAQQMGQDLTVLDPYVAHNVDFSKMKV